MGIPESLKMVMFEIVEKRKGLKIKMATIICWTVAICSHFYIYFAVYFC